MCLPASLPRWRWLHPLPASHSRIDPKDTTSTKLPTLISYSLKTQRKLLPERGVPFFFFISTTMDPARATSLEPQWLEQGTVCHEGGKSMIFFRTRRKNSFVGKRHKKTCHVPGSRVNQVSFPFFYFLSLRLFLF